MAALSSQIRRLPVSEPLHEASRVLLAISVMAVALRYPITEVRRQWRPVTLLLAVAISVMAAVTAGLGWALLSVRSRRRCCSALACARPTRCWRRSW